MCVCVCVCVCVWLCVGGSELERGNVKHMEVNCCKNDFKHGLIALEEGKGNDNDP